MGKRHLLVMTVAASLLLTPSAVAQTTLDAQVSVTPKAGGTPRHPQGHKIAVNATVVVPAGQVQPMVTGFELWFGPRWESHSEDVPACSRKTLVEGGPDACPPGSKLGLSGGNADFDDLEPQPTFQFFNAPGGQMLTYMMLQRPARVRAVIPITVRDGARGPWPLRYAWTFPQNMLVVAGIPITLRQLRFAFGYTQAGKGFISSTSCPKGGWAWKVRVHTRATVLAADGRAPCER